MNKIQQIYCQLHNSFGPQGWWPIVNEKTLLCEYGTGAPRDEAERWEIIASCILAQNTQWYPNVVRAIQQLKLGRELNKQELEVIRKAEIIRKGISGNDKKVTGRDLLTQNTAWKNVEKAIENLNRAKLLGIDKIRKAPVKKIAQLIRPAGYYNQKAERLKIVAEYFSKYFKEKTIPKREELLKVKGIGPETADSILLYAFEQPYFVVDAYTRRIFSRLGLIKKDASYDEIQKFFMDNLPKNKDIINIYKEYHALIVELAKSSCRAKSVCNACLLKNKCKNL